MANVTRREVLAIAATSAFALATPALADAPVPFSVNEIVDDGHRFFGALSHGLADVVQEAASRWGLPNAYILGQEASGAFVGGLRYGEGKMYMARQAIEGQRLLDPGDELLARACPQ